MSTRTLSVLLIAVVALGAATGAVAADEHELNVTVDDADAEPIVTVTHNDTTVENASVNVTTDDENVTYDGVGDYTTDENGTVALDAPEEDVTVNVTAEYENETTSTEVDLEAPVDLGVEVEQDPGEEALVTVTDGNDTAENASVNVTTDDENVTYDGVGDYTTDENGTVTLDAPEEDVTIDVTAEYENATASTTADLAVAADDEPEVRQPFGQQVRDFIRNLQGNGPGGFGAAVSDFVTGNNPGNAPDHAGNPHATNETANASDGPGNAPEHAGGPPEHAGPNHTETNESTDTGANGTEIDAADDSGNGNDDASGNSGTAGNGGAGSSDGGAPGNSGNAGNGNGGPGNGGGPPSN